MAPLKYYLNDFIAYGKERFSLKIYCPFALYMTIASFIGVPLIKVYMMFVNTAIILLLLFQFRLWDDLHSVKKDRMMYPQRVLCKSASINHYSCLLIILCLTGMGILYSYSITIIPAFSYLLLILFYICLYHFGTFNEGWIYNHLIIMKYVVIVFIVTSIHVNVIYIKNIYYPLISVFLVMSIYEVIHDENKYRNKSMRFMAIIESIMFILLNLSILVLNYSNTFLIVKLMNVLIFVSGVIFLLSIFHRVTSVKVLKYVPHGISFVQFLIILFLRGV